jgi:hypothetical protein
MHKHVPLILTWKLDENADYRPGMYGCTGCSYSGLTPPQDEAVEENEHLSHAEYVDGCFGCKAETLQMTPGDAKSGLIHNGYTQKSWNSELALYKEARKQGIQPDSTKRKDIEKAIDISNKTGHAYGSKL